MDRTQTARIIFFCITFDSQQSEIRYLSPLKPIRLAIYFNSTKWEDK